MDGTALYRASIALASKLCPFTNLTPLSAYNNMTVIRLSRCFKQQIDCHRWPSEAPSLSNVKVILINPLELIPLLYGHAYPVRDHQTGQLLAIN